MLAKTLLSIAAIAFAVPAEAQSSASGDVHSLEAGPEIPKRIAKIMAKRDGKSCATGYKVRGVGEEYQVLAALGLKPQSQALVSGKKPCDLLTAVDPQTGQEREVWFDISSFYPLF